MEFVQDGFQLGKIENCNSGNRMLNIVLVCFSWGAWGCSWHSFAHCILESEEVSGSNCGKKPSLEKLDYLSCTCLVNSLVGKNQISLVHWDSDVIFLSPSPLCSAQSNVWEIRCRSMPPVSRKSRNDEVENKDTSLQWRSVPARYLNCGFQLGTSEGTLDSLWRVWSNSCWLNPMLYTAHRHVVVHVLSCFAC